jgi:hypothetical protein
METKGTEETNKKKENGDTASVATEAEGPSASRRSAILWKN